MGDRINTEQRYYAETTWQSENGLYLFVFQNDRNLCLYRDNRDTQALWASDTWAQEGAQGCYVIMQQDGNFVMYDGGDNAIWATSSNFDAGTPFIAVQNDGNTCMYDDNQGGRDGHCYWATNTWQGT